MRTWTASANVQHRHERSTSVDDGRGQTRLNCSHKDAASAPIPTWACRVFGSYPDEHLLALLPMPLCLRREQRCSAKARCDCLV